MNKCLIDSKRDLSLHIWDWFSTRRFQETTERIEFEIDRYIEAPHWSNFVELMVEVILSGEDLPSKDPAKPITPTPSFEEDWTLFFNTVDLHAIANQIIRRETVKMIKHFFYDKHPESKWLCKCAACRNFVISRIAQQ